MGRKTDRLVNEHGWMDGWMHKWVYKQMMGRRTEGYVGGQMDGSDGQDGWVDK